MDDQGCGHYRLKWPGMELVAKFGDKLKMVMPGDDAGLKANLDGNKEVTGVVIPEDCEVVVLQRPTNHVLVETIPFVQAEGVRVVIDIDDDLAAVSPRHPVWPLLHSKSDTGHGWDAVTKSCEYADFVVAATPALLERYAKHGRGAVVRNRLPEHLFTAELKTPPEPAHVGWAGAILSHPDDLSVLGASLAQLGCPVRIVGPVPVDMRTRPPKEDWGKVRRLLGTDKVEFTGPIDFDCWIPAVSTLYIGMAPLQLDRFNIAKSWLKPLEMSVARVPFVASNTPEYSHLGAGMLASRPKDWRILLNKLLKDDTLRADEISRNYEIAGQNRLTDHVHEWREAWLG